MNESTAKTPNWRSWFTLSVLAALFSAAYYTNDTFVLHNVIVQPKDNFTAVLVYLLLGGWVLVVTSLIIGRIFGSKIDDTYTGLKQGSIRGGRQMHISAFIAGIIAAGSTLFYLMGSQVLDPSLVIALSNLTIIYLVVYDYLRTRTSINRILIPSLLVLIGSVMASIQKLEGLPQITLGGLLLLLVLRNGSNALGKIAEQKGSKSSDGITFTFWRFLYLAITGTFLAIAVSLFRGTFDLLIETTLGLFWTALPWIVLTMVFVIPATNFENTAKRIGDVSKVVMVVTTQIALGVPITLVLNTISPGLFGEIPTDGAVWIVRFIGAVVIILGVIPLRKTEETQPCS